MLLLLVSRLCLILLQNSGELLGKDQLIDLKLVETDEGMSPLRGVMMELEDGAFPLLNKVTATTDLKEGFGDASYAMLVSPSLSESGQNRSDIVSAEAETFSVYGKSLNEVTAANCKVVVVADSANTSALAASENAPDMWQEQFIGMTRVDQSRAKSILAEKAGVPVKDVDRVIIWGNRSATMYPDLSHSRVAGKWAKSVINDDKWIRDDFIPRVQKRGEEVIGARGASSAASAASAAIEVIKNLHLGSGDEWQSNAIVSNGNYGIETGLFYSVPTVCHGDSHFRRVLHLPIDEFSAEKMNASEKELLQERDSIRHLLPGHESKPVSWNILESLKESYEAGDMKTVDELAKNLPQQFKKSIENAKATQG